MFRKSLIVFVISIFLFSAVALTEADAKDKYYQKTVPVAVPLPIVEPLPVEEPLPAGVGVYDADGQYLGVVVDFSRSAEPITIHIPSLSKFISVRSDKIELPAEVLRFQSADCTGTPYFILKHAYFIGENNGKYYTGTKNESAVELELNSSLYTNGVCDQATYTRLVVPVEEVPADSIPFTLPVALPLEFK